MFMTGLRGDSTGDGWFLLFFKMLKLVNTRGAGRELGAGGPVGGPPGGPPL
jgi:hypothetical protein